MVFAIKTTQKANWKNDKYKKNVHVDIDHQHIRGDHTMFCG